MDRAKLVQSGKCVLLEKMLHSVTSSHKVFVIDVQGLGADSESAETNESEKVTVVTVTPISVENHSEEKEEQNSIKSRDDGFRFFANPFIEAYYPFLDQTPVGEDAEIEKVVETPAEPEAKPSEGKSEPSESQHSALCNLAEKNVVSEKENKRNQIPQKSTSESKKNLSRLIIEHFLSKTDSSIRNLLEVRKNRDEQIHLHHHEHHHHYYFNKSSETAKDSHSGPKRDSPASEVFASKTSDRERKSDERKSFNERMREEEKSAYYYECDRGVHMPDANAFNPSAATFLKTSGAEGFDGSDGSENRSKSNQSRETSGSFSPPPRLKPSGSLDSILNKRSCFIVTLNYSDTELSKLGSEDVTLCEQSSSLPEQFTVIRPKEYLKVENKSKLDYADLVRNFKKIDFSDPKVVMDSVKGSKISYIRCETTKTGGRLKEEQEPKMSQENFCCLGLNSDTKKNKEQTAEEGNETNVCEEPSTSHQDTGISPYSAKENEERLEVEMAAINWSKRLKQELREIKKELRRLEEKHLKRKRKSLAPVHQGGNLIRPNISVYSSKTFIVGSHGVLPSQRCERCRASKESGLVMESKSLSCRKQKVNYHFMPPMGIKLFRKTFMPENCNTVVDEHYLSSRQEVFLAN